MLVRILRGCPGTYITLHGIKGIDLELKRDLRTPSTAAFAAAQSRLEEFWRLIADLGVGQVSRDAYEHFCLRKYHRNALCRNTLDWLEQNRVPGFMLGIGEATCSRGTNTKAVALRGTNPSVTVRASHGTAAQAMVAATQEQAAATSEPLVSMTKEKKPVSTARMLHSEIVEGILSGQESSAGAHARAFIIAEVNNVNPLAHDQYFLFQGKCLWCKDAAQAIVFKGTYCRQAVEVPPKTFTLTSLSPRAQPRRRRPGGHRAHF